MCESHIVLAIDTQFDFRVECPGRDSDIASPTLRKYHQALWSKVLPSGRYFALSISEPGAYLYHDSKIGVHSLSSDSIAPTFTRWESMKHITEKLDESENEAFRHLSSTIGGRLVFPAKQVDRKFTINQARGVTRSISDRIDLTLECVRRHYLNIDSPLSSTFSRYASFFDLFESFQGYIDYFLLNDLVPKSNKINYFTPFNNFQGSALPQNLKSYLAYKEKLTEFIASRNLRIRTNHPL